MALAIAEAGASVVLVGRDQPSLDKTSADIRERGQEEDHQGALERHGHPTLPARHRFQRQLKTR